jgi:hypothetical protein
LASLTQTRDTPVKLRTALKNKVNNIPSARGLDLAKEGPGSEKALDDVLELPFDEIARIEARGIVRSDPQPEQEHRGTGQDHWRGRLQAGKDTRAWRASRGSARSRERPC